MTASQMILIGESGTGKTMLATALAVCACQQGRRVRFTTLAGLATELQEADSRKELARVVGRYSRIEVLLLDELGYLALPDGAAELVFQVISRTQRTRIADRDHQPAVRQSAQVRANLWAVTVSAHRFANAAASL